MRFEGRTCSRWQPEERARAGIFLGFQYPVEIPGVSNSAFLRLAYNTVQGARGKDELDPLEFDDFVREKMKLLEMDPSFLDRSVNEGFSGGEKKRNEILQLAAARAEARDARRDRLRARHRCAAHRRGRRQPAARPGQRDACW